MRDLYKAKMEATKKANEPVKVRGFEVVYGASEDTILPVKGTDEAAGYDFFAPEDIYVKSGLSKTIWLNIKAYMQVGEYLEIKNRSSMMAKHDTMIFCSAIIDSDYYSNPNNDGNIGIRLLNFGKPFVIEKGQRICQGIFYNWLPADNTKSLGARIGGFGSTGK